MFKVGDKVILRWDDEPTNFGIIEKVSVVVEAPTDMRPPCWMVVSCAGKEYTVRGTDCQPAKMEKNNACNS